MDDIKAEHYYESAMMQLGAGDKPTAVLQLQQALMLRPDYDVAWNNRGNILFQLGHPFDAILNFDRALALSPNVAEFHNNKGAALSSLLKLDEALACYERAISINPKFEHALTNKANILKLMGRFDEAIDIYQQAIDFKPDFGTAHLHRSLTLLEAGRLKEGWKEYEWRWKVGQLPPRGLPQPQWNGEPLEGKTLLIYAEQGHGDTLQFIRYAPLVKERFGGKVYVEVRTPLARLCRTVKGIDGILVFGEPNPHHIDYIIPMLSLPRILGTDTVADIPGGVPYFSTDPVRETMWREKLKFLPKSAITVGLCWAGGSRPQQSEAYDVDQRRSMRIQDFKTLSSIPGISWVSLQKGPPSTQIMDHSHGLVIGDWTDDMDDFADTAAMVSCLDLVITVDTSVAHLAGALGVPVWVLSRFDSCWRWLGPREDSPWYPSLRHLRQPAPQQWQPVLDRIAFDLRALVEKSKAAA